MANVKADASSLKVMTNSAGIGNTAVVQRSTKGKLESAICDVSSHVSGDQLLRHQ